MLHAGTATVRVASGEPSILLLKDLGLNASLPKETVPEAA